jgi:catechol 2,3-dioxygenase-like lactoylglutathione lyase family enzyme
VIVAIDHVQLAMPPGEEARARDFYWGALGFDEVAKPAELAGRGGCWFEKASVRVHLGVEPSFQPARKAHPAFRVKDLALLLAACGERGYIAYGEEQQDDVYRAYIDDPFGNRIELIEARPEEHS